jgi:hypothetical protein
MPKVLSYLFEKALSSKPWVHIEYEKNIKSGNSPKQTLPGDESLE